MLKEIENGFKEEIFVVLHGMVGIGKSTVAMQFATQSMKY